MGLTADPVSYSYVRSAGTQAELTRTSYQACNMSNPTVHGVQAMSCECSTRTC
jgi:hypothetical protein